MMRKKYKSGNPLGILVGIAFVAILLAAGLITSRAAHQSQPVYETAYVEFQ